MDKSKKPAARPRGPRGKTDTQVEQVPTVARAASTPTAPSDVVSDGNARTDVWMDSATEADLIDPRDPRTPARLQRRTATGGYEIPEAALVRAVRAWGQRGEPQKVRALLEVLIDRCMPEFKRRAWGLRHRP